jgi:hypothetical protein
MKRITLVLGVMMTLAMAAPADVIVVVDPGVDAGGGLTRYTVHLVANSSADAVVAFDGGFSGPMNQVLFGGAPTPTLDFFSFMTPTEKAQDSHFLFLLAELDQATPPAETSNSLTGIFGIKPAFRQTELPFAQIVLADGDSITLTGEVANGAGDAFDVSTVIPEPATMSLLGLGALAIIRRRRKQQ